MKVVSLFSGAGGLDLGLTKAGHEIIWANDIDKDSCDTYIKNIGNHIICDDISNVKIEEIPDCEVVVGGFPCQGFSLANKLRAADDERNKLYQQFYRVIKRKKPEYFLAENVRGILSLDKGNVIKQIVKDFADAGYRVKYKSFNTADYGVPQTRIRVIIAGTRNDIPEKLGFQYPEPTHEKSNWVSISKALGNIPEPDEPYFELKKSYLFKIQDN